MFGKPLLARKLDTSNLFLGASHLEILRGGVILLFLVEKQSFNISSLSRHCKQGAQLSPAATVATPEVQSANIYAKMSEREKGCSGPPDGVATTAGSPSAN